MGVWDDLKAELVVAARVLAGLAIAAAAAYVGWVALPHAPACGKDIDRRLLAGVGAAIFFGGYIIAPGLIGGAAKGVISIVASLITALKNSGESKP
jgi:hypothetical protein